MFIENSFTHIMLEESFTIIPLFFMIGQYFVGEASLLSGLKYKYFHITYIVFQVLFGHIVYWIFYAFLIEIRQYLFFIKTKTRLN